MEIDLLLFAVSLAMLWGGALLLVRGAVGLGKLLGLGPFFVGFALVALGTSAPELVVCLAAAFMGSSDIAVGNMVGSNVANIGLIFGLTVLVSPVAVTAEAWEEQKTPLALLLVVTLMAFVLGRTGFHMNRWEGVLLLLPLAYLLLRRRFGSDEETEDSATRGVRSVATLALCAVGGSALLAVGAHVLVGEAIEIAAAMGISEIFIGAAVVAVGTSLPELAASLAAAWRREQDVVVGNIIGSNFFNLAFLGLVAAAQPVEVSHEMFGSRPQFWFLVGFTFLLALFMVKAAKTGKNRIGRKKGSLALALYAAFVWAISGSLP